MSLKKCGSRDCIICKPPRLNDQDFKRLNHLPNPIPGTDDHYKELGEVKPRLVYTAKRLTETEKKSFNCVMNDMMYTCGATLVKFKDLSNLRNRQYDILDKCFVTRMLCPLWIETKIDLRH